MSTPEQLRPEDEARLGPDRPRVAESKVEPAPEAEAFPGAALLTGDRPKDVLRRIHEGDPLGIRLRCQARVDTHAVLLSEERLFARSIARIAYAARRYAGEPALKLWLDERIDQALEELILEDREAERLDLEPDEETEWHYAFLTTTLGVESNVARAAAIVFNDLPEEIRAAFWSLVIRGEAMKRHAVERGVTLEVALARARRAIEAISMLRDPEAPPDTGRDR